MLEDFSRICRAPRRGIGLRRLVDEASSHAWSAVSRDACRWLSLAPPTVIGDKETGIYDPAFGIETWSAGCAAYERPAPLAAPV